MGPRSVPNPSPKSTRTLTMFAPGAGVTVNVTGVPALGDAGLAPKALRLRVLTLTVTAVLEMVPAVAVTLAVAVVVSVATAWPLLSVGAVDGEIDPLSVAKVTG